MKLAGLRSHLGRTHAGLPLKYTSVLDTSDFKPVNVKDKPKGGKQKTYKCPICSYERIFPTSAFNNVRLHIRTHFKSFCCGLCSGR